MNVTPARRAAGSGWFSVPPASIAPLSQPSVALRIASQPAAVAPQPHQALTITALGAVQALQNARCWPTTLHAATSFAPHNPPTHHVHSPRSPAPWKRDCDFKRQICRLKTALFPRENSTFRRISALIHPSASSISARIPRISSMASFSRLMNSFSSSWVTVSFTEMSANLAGNRIDVSSQDKAE